MNLRFRDRLLLTIGFSCILCTASAIFVSSQRLNKNGQEALVEKSRAILSRLEVGAAYVAKMDTLKAVVEETIRKYPNGDVPDEQKLKVLKSVPVFAAFQLGKTNAEKENYQFRVASDTPRNKDNKATPEEAAVIERFRNNPQLQEIVETSPDGNFMLVSRPVRISEANGCLTCHGNPAQSPWKNGKDILGYTMENIKDGDLRGTFTIISSLEPVKASANASIITIVMWGGLITILALVISYLAVRGSLNGLMGLAHNLAQAADEVASMSTEIASTSEQLSSGATEQAAALEETSASMEEMSAMVTKNAENADRSRNVANTSQSTAQRGKSAVEEMIHSISEIDRSNTDIMAQIEDSNRQIAEIVKVIGDIGNKTKVINDIVFQTKLLSFNASVEAARAGENGKGFAVVAEEVGNLAQMSGNAAAEITQMLDDSIQRVESIVNDTKSKVEGLVRVGKTKVESGTQVAKQCADVLNDIVNSVNSVTQMVSEIANGSTEQAKGVQEINRAMVQLNQVTQQNTVASQESSAAAERLSRQSESLRDSVQSVMAVLNGTYSGAPAPMASPKSSAGSNVTSIAEHRQHVHAPKKAHIVAKPAAAAPVFKKASGDPLASIPRQDDDRFEDI